MAVPTDSAVTIRTAGAADAEAIDDLTQAAYARWVPIAGRKPLPMTVDYHRAVIEHRIDLAEGDGRLLALVELELQPDHVLIVNLAVAPAAQGRGLVKLLLAHAESVARDAGITELRLYTNGLMAPNIALYQRQGYAITGKDVRGPDWTVVHMAKRLSP